MRGHALTTKVLTSIWKHCRRPELLTGMAIVVGPSALQTGSLPEAPLATATRNPSTHDLILTAIALTIEITLFLLVPIYLRARRREKIRARIHMLSETSQKVSVFSRSPLRSSGNPGSATTALYRSRARSPRIQMIPRQGENHAECQQYAESENRQCDLTGRYR